MQDDIRPPQGPKDTVWQPQAPKPGSTAIAAHQNAPAVDEKKLEAEFGPPPLSNYDSPATPLSPKRKIMKLLPAFALHYRPHHKRTLLLLSLILVLLAGATSYAVLYFYNPQELRLSINARHHKPLPPKEVPSTLTGLLVDPSVNDRPVTAVMIENSLDARPQSGLDQAGVVFEALAEGGVTRFMALYQDTQPDYIGPVRSARPYYIAWLLGFDAAYAHVGGSADGLADITAWHVKDLNQFYNASAYERISTRYAPHNVYTSMAQLSALESSKGFGNSTYTGFTRINPNVKVPVKTPTVTSIDINFSGYYYDTHYDYDAATNTYKRSESGAPHMELNKDGSQVQIAPKVVVAMIVPEQNGALDSSGAYYADYAAIGSGQIEVFQDGQVQTGTWNKPSNTAQITFTDAGGKPLALEPGQVWIAATPLMSNVTYK